jgi:thioredoxin reductase (NADPH)
VTRELVIVGAGPAGVSAALRSRLLDLEPLVLESAAGAGGQLLHVHFEPRDIAGTVAADGQAIARGYERQLAGAGIAVRFGADVRALEPGAEHALVLGGGERILARAVLVSTGVRRRRLGVPGERELEDRGVSYSATRDRDLLAGRDVAVVGGGDSACENALLLAEAGSAVTLIARGRLRARREFGDRVAAAPRIRVLEGARVLAVLGHDAVTGLRLAAPDGERELACSGVVIKVGVDPNTEWCRGALALDERGFLEVDAGLATGVPGVWAAGDVTRPARMSVAGALGHGALAAAAIRRALRGD